MRKRAPPHMPARPRTLTAFGWLALIALAIGAALATFLL